MKTVNKKYPIEDVYIGELSYIYEYTKYYVGERKEENAKFFYDQSSHIRYILFTLDDNIVPSLDSEEELHELPRSHARDLSNKNLMYPVIGEIDPNYVKENSIVVTKHYNLGNLLKISGYKKEVSFKDLEQFMKIVGAINICYMPIEPELKTFLKDYVEYPKLTGGGLKLTLTEVANKMRVNL